MMKIVSCHSHALSNEHFVVDVDHDGVMFETIFSIEDILINSPYGDCDMAFHPDLVNCINFPDKQCLRIPGKPDVKEITKVFCTRVALKCPEEVQAPIKVWITFQRN